MSARATRRPHARTPRPRDVKPTRRSGGGDDGGEGPVRFALKSVGCPLTVALLAALAAPVAVFAEVIWGVVAR